MYTKKTWYMPKTVEVEKTYQWRYGAPGCPRAKKKKATQEDIERQNQWIAGKKLRRTINVNFGADDLHLILTYMKENRPAPEDQPKILRRFLADVRKIYKKAGFELKWIMVTEYGERGAVHHHMIINNIHTSDTNTQKIVNKCWKHGRPTGISMDDSGEYKDLAEYLIKQSSRSFRQPGNPFKGRYSCSRNLIKPEPEVEKMNAAKWRDEPKISKAQEKDGWYLDYDSLVTGHNRVTGYPYQYYTLRRLCDMTPLQKEKYKIYKMSGHWPGPKDDW